MISYKRLWRLLESRQISTYQLRNKHDLNNISSTSIYRLLNNESVSTNTLDSLCKILNCKLDDIAEFIPDEQSDAKVGSHDLL